ncbi:hypothetical protein E4T66_15395 [Sinimarinibacterium sp. CAU 1509]|nr:hypothetical protein E4T66_15395 [Sinimarinibacterium sp. CAU 1509]
MGKKMGIKQWGCIAALLVASTSAGAYSDELRPYLDLGAQYTGADDLRQSDDGIGGFFGVGMPLLRNFAIEGTLSGSNFGANGANGIKWTEYTAEAAGLLTYPIGNGWIPYLTVGVGVANNKPDGGDRESDALASFGAGTFYLWDRWGVRADARYRRINADVSDLEEPVYRLGLLYMLTPKPVAAAEPEKDSDGDGVPDSRDKCPDTPKGAKVDADGCEFPPEVGAPAEVVDTLGIVYFDFDRSEIKGGERAKLDKAAEVAMAKKGAAVVLKLDGHTDYVGTDEYNVGLGERRGAAVKQYLISKGVPAEEIIITSYGESRPAADNATAEGRSLNRRVELFLVEK